MVVYKDNSLPQEIYSGYLKKIGDIEFTAREIDVISFMLSGRSAKKTASFLSLSPKTIESYTRNIMLKLKCNSREGVIDFMEKSHQIHNIQMYYNSLLVQTYFEDQLKCISEINKEMIPVMEIYYYKKKHKTFFIEQLIRHLKLAGIKISLESPENSSFFLQQSRNISELDVMVCDIQNTLIKEPQAPNKHHSSHINQNTSRTLLLFLGGRSSENIPHNLKRFDFLELHAEKHYYKFVFIILKKVMSHLDISKFHSKFEERYSILHKNLNCTTTTQISSGYHYSLKKTYNNYLNKLIRYFIINKKKVYWLLVCFIIFFTISLISFSILVCKEINYNNEMAVFLILLLLYFFLHVEEVEEIENNYPD